MAEKNLTKVKSCHTTNLEKKKFSDTGKLSAEIDKAQSIQIPVMLCMREFCLSLHFLFEKLEGKLKADLPQSLTD